MNLLFYAFILIFSFKKWSKCVAENGYDKLSKITLVLLITQVVLASIYFVTVLFYNNLTGSSLVNIIQTAFITTSMIPLIIDWNAKRKLNGLTGQSSIFILISMVLVMVIMAYTIVAPK